MMNDEDQARLYHEDADLFRAALSFTERDSGFSARLIEKDYYCTVALRDLGEAFPHALIFRGGTSLSKVHTDFYRLSEDLDFVVSTPPEASRSECRRAIAPFKKHFSGMPARCPCFELAELLRGSNVSQQYIGRLTYVSAATGQRESIKIEVGLREPVLEPAERKPARTLLTDPFRARAAVAPVTVLVLSLRETFAEKFRAALTRREPAIRDVFDVDYAVGANLVDHTDEALLSLVRRKLDVPGNHPVDVSEMKRASLQQQVEPQLKAVLRSADFETFDLDRAFGIVEQVAESL